VIVTLDGVTKRYGEVRALDGADLSVAEGSITGIIGPNGAGKTTTMEIVSTLLDRDRGQVRVAGIDPQADPRGVRNVLGWMPDFFGVYEGLVASEYLDFFAASHGVAKAKRKALVGDLLSLVDLESKAGADVNTLSRGMKQRLSLARALVHDPQILVLDEPASGLDPRARVQLRELVAELARLGKTVIISSHILSELEGICSHMAIVDRGKVKAQGTVGEIRAALHDARRVVVRTSPADSDGAEQVIRASNMAADIVVERDRIVLSSPESEDTLAGLLAVLVGAGIRVIEWRVETAGLEDLFLRLTEDGDE
jgi:ABC-2 type transport system ATP-binding protein